MGIEWVNRERERERFEKDHSELGRPVGDK